MAKDLLDALTAEAADRSTNNEQRSLGVKHVAGRVADLVARDLPERAQVRSQRDKRTPVDDLLRGEGGRAPGFTELRFRRDR